MENLQLKAEALDFLELPIKVMRGRAYFHTRDSLVKYHAIGFVGKLRLQVPWSRLKSEPVILMLEDVFLIAGPNVRAKVCLAASRHVVVLHVLTDNCSTMQRPRE